MRLTLSRSGGFAGLVRPPVVVDTAKLPPAHAKRCHALIDTARFFSLPEKLAGTSQPDRFEYRLEVQHEDGRTHGVTFSETNAAPALLELVQAIQTAAKK